MAVPAASSDDASTRADALGRQTGSSNLIDRLDERVAPPNRKAKQAAMAKIQADIEERALPPPSQSTPPMTKRKTSLGSVNKDNTASKKRKSSAVIANRNDDATRQTMVMKPLNTDVETAKGVHPIQGTKLDEQCSAASAPQLTKAQEQKVDRVLVKMRECAEQQIEALRQELFQAVGESDSSEAHKEQRLSSRRSLRLDVSFDNGPMHRLRTYPVPALSLLPLVQTGTASSLRNSPEHVHVKVKSESSGSSSSQDRFEKLHRFLTSTSTGQGQARDYTVGTIIAKLEVIKSFIGLESAQEVLIKTLDGVISDLTQC